MLGVVLVGLIGVLGGSLGDFWGAGRATWHSGWALGAYGGLGVSWRSGGSQGGSWGAGERSLSGIPCPSGVCGWCDPPVSPGGPHVAADGAGHGGGRDPPAPAALLPGHRAGTSRERRGPPAAGGGTGPGDPGMGGPGPGDPRVGGYGQGTPGCRWGHRDRGPWDGGARGPWDGGTGDPRLQVGAQRQGTPGWEARGRGPWDEGPGPGDPQDGGVPF